MNPSALDDARASDARRAHGETLSPLDGIPYTAKDSYLARGLTAAAGSPAFEHLVAQRDAFTIERLRAAGGYSIVFDVSTQANNVVTADKSLDLSEQVIAELKKPS